MAFAVKATGDRLFEVVHADWDCTMGMVMEGACAATRWAAAASARVSTSSPPESRVERSILLVLQSAGPLRFITRRAW